MKQFYRLYILLLTMPLQAMNHEQHGWAIVKTVSFQGPTSCAYDKDNRFVIGLTKHQFIIQYSLLSGEPAIFFEYKAPIAQISLSPAEKYLYGLSSKDPHCTKRLYTLWSIATKKIVHQLERPNFYYHISPSDTYLITQDKAIIEIRNAQTSSILHFVKPLHEDITTLNDPYFAPHFNHNETLIAIAHKAFHGAHADESRIINLATRMAHSIYGSQCAPAFSPDGKYIATATKNGTVNVFSTQGFKLFKILKNSAHGLLFTPTNKLIIKHLDPELQMHISLKKENEPLCFKTYDPHAQSLSHTNPVFLSDNTTKYDHAIICNDARKLCVINHQQQRDLEGTYHALQCNIVHTDTLYRIPLAEYILRKLYPAPLYMSPGGSYIVIPSYGYDLMINESEMAYCAHPSGRYGNLNFSNDEKTIAYQQDNHTVLLLEKY